MDKIFNEIMAGGASFLGTCYIKETPFPDLHYAISFGIKLSSAIIGTISENGPSKTYFHHYRTVNTRLDGIALSAVLELEKMGYRAAAIPASQSISGTFGLFSHKKAAVASGLGSIGKNAMFISKDFGPAVRLCTVFTDRELPHSECEPMDLCGDCEICKNLCPASAISGKKWGEATGSDFFDAISCSEHMKKAYKDIGRGAVCGICMRYCKYNTKK